MKKEINKIYKFKIDKFRNKKIFKFLRKSASEKIELEFQSGIEHQWF